MLDGTYAIRTYLSRDDSEENTLVLCTQDGGLSGSVAEIAYRPVPFSGGTADGGAFSVDVPPFITIVGDLSLRISGERRGDDISGTMELLGMKLPFTGTRVGGPAAPGAGAG